MVGAEQDISHANANLAWAMAWRVNEFHAVDHKLVRDVEVDINGRDVLLGEAVHLE